MSFSLTTFRRSGEPVSTPAWVVRAGDGLVVTTPSQSGKVERLRNNDDVELRPCSRRGIVKAGTAWVPATAELDPDPGAHNTIGHLFAASTGGSTASPRSWSRPSGVFGR
jgi:PPOX class probable F420-dependent enzyme